ncbi:Neutral ceramidase [Symbiodinium microadriaticum]|uniref:Neutral ceramidase n=1 Tax=Symbiodinium microadriaticum TaxID=2951 RepID=A0A1Q9D221_SYMMI|nr:Neutral ceramidase [Symbiodinium microadriaticum]
MALPWTKKVLLCATLLRPSSAARPQAPPVHTAAQAEHPWSTAGLLASRLPWPSFMQTFEWGPPPNGKEPPPPEIVQKCLQEMQPLVEKDFHALDPDIREAQQNPHGFDGMKSAKDVEKVWESQKKHCDSDKDMELCSVEIKMGRDKLFEQPQTKGMEFELTCSLRSHAYKMGWSLILTLATANVAVCLERRLWFELPGFYSRHNVLIGPSHTHMGPAGTSPYYLYQFSSFGYVKQSTQALVDGMFEAVRMAHHNIRPAQVFLGRGPVDNSTVPGCPMPHCASRNRSPTSYLHNPEAERAAYDGDTDKIMDLLKVMDATTGEAMGTLNFFPVHTTSMKSSSGLISGDNKGYAEYAFEKAINGPSEQNPAGRGPFVAAFAQGAAGDVSPNVHGSWCEGTGTSCETAQSALPPQKSRQPAED